MLLTPDEEARLRQELRRPGDDERQGEFWFQPRANVLFEAGMALGRQPARTILVEVGRTRPFSDVAGRYVIHLDDSLARRQELAGRLKLAGCEVDLSGADWHVEGQFGETGG